jgi:hypothetical protein
MFSNEVMFSNITEGGGFVMKCPPHTTSSGLYIVYENIRSAETLHQSHLC